LVPIAIVLACNNSACDTLGLLLILLSNFSRKPSQIRFNLLQMRVDANVLKMDCLQQVLVCINHFRILVVLLQKGPVNGSKMKTCIECTMIPLFVTNTYREVGSCLNCFSISVHCESYDNGCQQQQQHPTLKVFFLVSLFAFLRENCSTVAIAAQPKAPNKQ
jgi:hypothetical protein